MVTNGTFPEVPTTVSGQHIFIPREISTFEKISISVHCLEAFLGAFLNILTITSILKFKKLWVSSHILILSLSCSDCLPLVARIFTVLNVIYREDLDLWNTTCLLQTYFLILSNSLSVSTIAAIATERALSIVFAVWARNHLSIRVMQKVAIVLWITFIGVTVLFITDGRQKDMVQIHCKWKEVFTPEYYNYGMNAAFISTSLVTLIMYTAIMVKIRSIRSRSKVTSVHLVDKKQQDQIKFSKMMGTGKHGASLML